MENITEEFWVKGEELVEKSDNLSMKEMSGTMNLKNLLKMSIS